MATGSPRNEQAGTGTLDPSVSYSRDEDRRLPKRIAASLRSQIEMEKDALVGEADKTFEDIKRRQGYIAGLTWALQEAERADKELNGT